MKVELISVGDELLIGQTLNTNVAWMGKCLNEYGFQVSRSTSISDEKSEIISALDEALSRASIVLMTGGLGPTKDDITKHTLCEYFGTSLVLNQEVLNRIELYFKNLGRPMLESNIQQAMLPSNCIVLANLKGTASGMWFQKEGKVVVSMPGVPYEMEYLMNKEVMPRLTESYIGTNIVHRSVVTHGIGESFLAEIIKEWEDGLDADGLKLAYLPGSGLVKLRLSSYQNPSDLAEALMTKRIAELKKLIPEYFAYEGDFGVEKKIADVFSENKLKLAVAESFTGGRVGSLLTQIPGASAFFKGSLVCYDRELKTDILGIDSALIDQYGAESEQVVAEMAGKVRNLLRVDYALATSGFAGPDGGTPDTPVGTVFLAVAGPNGVRVERKKMGTDRLRVIERSTMELLHLLRKELSKDLGN